MDKESLKEHLLNIIDTLEEITEFNVRDVNPTEIGNCDGWREFQASPIIEIKVLGIREIK